MGKTVTAEYAYYHPGKTRNPHDPERTPGGSSSGSAAAVAAGMVPGAIGSQTNGSTIRPAAFCGVVGFKPTHGLIPRTGALLLSRALDHVGVFARTRGGCRPARRNDGRLRRRGSRHAAACASAARRDRGQRAAAAAAFRVRARAAWEQVEPVMSEAFAELIDAMGDAVTEIELGMGFDNAIDLHRTVMEVDMAHNLHRDYEQGGDQLSAALRAAIERGRSVPAVEYLRAVAAGATLNAGARDVFNEYDAI